MSGFVDSCYIYDELICIYIYAARVLLFLIYGSLICRYFKGTYNFNILLQGISHLSSHPSYAMLYTHTHIYIYGDLSANLIGLKLIKVNKLIKVDSTLVAKRMQIKVRSNLHFLQKPNIISNNYGQTCKEKYINYWKPPPK